MQAYLPYVGMVLLVAVFYLIERARPEAVTRFEENVLAILLAMITIVSFFQVIARARRKHSSTETSGAMRTPPIAGPQTVLSTTRMAFSPRLGR